METPQNHKGVARTSRVNMYYQKFTKNYGRIAAPITTLLKKYAFSQSSENIVNLAQNRMEQQRDEHRSDISFDVGDSFTTKTIKANVPQAS